MVQNHSNWFEFVKKKVQMVHNSPTLFKMVQHFHNISKVSKWFKMCKILSNMVQFDQIWAKHQNCHFGELKKEPKITEKNLKELKLSK